MEAGVSCTKIAIKSITIEGYKWVNYLESILDALDPESTHQHKTANQEVGKTRTTWGLGGNSRQVELESSGSEMGSSGSTTAGGNCPVHCRRIE